MKKVEIKARTTKWWMCPECTHEVQTTNIIIRRGYDVCERCETKVEIDSIRHFQQ